jgi:hypothetical protein
VYICPAVKVFSAKMIVSAETESSNCAYGVTVHAHETPLGTWVNVLFPLPKVCS